jgi:predicted branched-subunit amino acid permease
MSELSPALHAPVWRHPEFARGAREMVPTAMGIAAWGLVTGVAMTKSGLGVALSMLMSLLVFAGSSQLASLPLIASGAPMWVVLATAFCVNLRFIIFSAQWRPYFARFKRFKRLALAYFTADLNFVIFMRRFPKPEPSPEQVPYFLGGVSVNWFAWQLPSMVGIFAADRIPTEWGIGFAGTLALLGLIYSMLSDKATWVAAAVAGCAAVAAYALPLKLNILVAIAAAVAIGLLMDHTVRTPAPVEDRT